LSINHHLGLLVLLIVGLPAGKVSSQSASTHVVTGAEYDRWKTDLSNWGRWGKDDQIGALNLITPEKRKQAAGLVKEGFSVSLAGDADTVQAVDNPNPYDVKMLAIGNDRIGVAYHGIAHTHLDSLAHINDNGVFYNGYKPDPDAVLKEATRRIPFTTSRMGFSPRHPDRHSAAQRCCVFGAGYAHLCGRPGGMGKRNGRQGIGRRRALFVRTGVWARRKELDRGFAAEPKG
jgi:hypothetical protein